MDTLGDCKQCPAGTYQTGTGMISLGDCILCRAGTFQSLLGRAFEAACISCAAGEFQTMEGAVNRSLCLKCPAGTYQPEEGSGEPCTACAAGLYGTGTGLSLQTHACLPCPEGTYQTQMGAVNSLACLACFEGSYQPFEAAESDDYCTLCPPGTYQPVTGASQESSCLPCQVGTYQPGLGASSTSDCLLCGSGKYQTAEGGGTSATCLLCPAGTFQTSQAGGDLSTCTKCSAGFYQPSTGATALEACVPCSAGTFQTAVGSTTGAGCSLCAAGTFQSAQGAGSSSFCLGCPSGTYHTGLGAITSSVCGACGAGMFSSGNGMSSLTSCSSCEPGTYQPSAARGASACTDCEPGEYQDLSGQPNCTACRAGTFQPLKKVNLEWWCRECESGTYSNTTGATSDTVCISCIEGKYTSQGGETVCQDCPRGHYNSAPKSRLCFSCMSGTYGNSTGGTACLGCSPGESVAVVGASACESCAPGEFQFLNSSKNCLPCPRGQFQPNSGATECSLCRIGLFQSTENATSCHVCPPGSFSPSPGATVCTPCSKGAFQPFWNSTFCALCSVGKFQPLEGQDSCSPCDRGRYQPSQASSLCLECVPGEFQTSTGASDCDQCPSGSFRDQSAGSSWDACQNCSAGTYSLSRGATVCLPCAQGAFTTLQGATQCSVCGLGQYQTASGATYCTQCLPGMYSKQLGLAQREGCLLCQEGTHAPSSGASDCMECPLGTFASAKGSTNCSDCPAGSYMNERGWRTPDCIQCPAGTFSAEIRGQTPDVCTLCQDGFYSQATGQSSASTCSICQRGTVSVDTKHQCRVCTAGELCPTGYHTPIRCVPGLVCNGTHITGGGGILPYLRGNCTGAIPCPRGTRCESEPSLDWKGILDPTHIQNQTYFAVFEGNGSEIQLSCPGESLRITSTRLDWPYQGVELGERVLFRLLPRICPAGSYLLYDTCVNCPPGTFSPVVGAMAPSVCVSCPAGTFRSTAGGSSCTICPVGGQCSQARLTSWAACRPGFYQSIQGATSCLACPAGTFARSTKSSICTLCSAGDFQPAAASQGCLACQQNQFSSSGDHSCSQCGADLSSLDPGFSCTPPVLPVARDGIMWLSLSGEEGQTVDQCLSTGSIPTVTANQLMISYALMTRRPGACVTTLSIMDHPGLARRWLNPVGRLNRPVSVRVVAFNQTFYPELCRSEGFGVLFTVADSDGELLTDLTAATATMDILDPTGRGTLFTMTCERIPNNPNANVPLGVCRTKFCPIMSVLVRVRVVLRNPSVTISNQTLLHPGPVGACIPTSSWMAEVLLPRGSIPHFPGSTFDLQVRVLNPPANTRLAVFRFAVRILAGVTLLSVQSSYSVVTERAGGLVIVVGDASQGGGNLLATMVFRVDASTSGVLLFAQLVPQAFQFTLVNAVPYAMPVRALGFSCRSDGYVDVLLDFQRPTTLITNLRRPYVINWRRIQTSAVETTTGIHVVAVNNAMNSYGNVPGTCVSLDPRNFEVISCSVIRAGNKDTLGGMIRVTHQSAFVLVSIECWVPSAATFGIAFTSTRMSGRYRVLTTLTAGPRAIHGVDATPFLPRLLGLGVALSSSTGLWKCFRTGQLFTIGSPAMYVGVCGPQAPVVLHYPASFFLVSSGVAGTAAIGSYTFPPAVVSASMPSATLLLFSSHGVFLGIANTTLREMSTRLTVNGNVLALRSTGESARCVDLSVFSDPMGLDWTSFPARVPVFPAAPRSLDITLSTRFVLAPDHVDGVDTFIPSSVFVTRAFLVFSDGTRLSVQDDPRLNMLSQSFDVSGLAAMPRPTLSGEHTLTFALSGIPCVTTSTNVTVVTSSVLRATLVCPGCPLVMSLADDPLSQQFPTSFPSSLDTSAVFVRRLLVDGRVLDRSEPLQLSQGSDAVTLATDGRVSSRAVGTAGLTTMVTPGQTVAVTVIPRWAASVQAFCNAAPCPSSVGVSQVKLAPKGDGASLPPFGYASTLAVALTLTLFNGSTFSPSEQLSGVSLFVNNTRSETFLLTNLSCGKLSLRLDIAVAWAMGYGHDLGTGDGLSLQVEKLSHITVNGPHTLRQIHCSGFWEEAVFSATGVLTDGTTMNVPALFQGRGGSLVMHNATGFFHATSPGAADVIASFGGHQATMTVQAVESSIFFSGATVDSTPSIWTAQLNSILRLSPRFTPPMYTDEWFPSAQVAERVLQWVSSVPGVIQIAQDQAATIVLRGDWYEPVVVTGTFIACQGLAIPPQPVSKAITVNVAPSNTGDLDMGAAQGLPLPRVPIDGSMDIPIYVYVAPGLLRAYMMDVEVVGSGLGPETCSAGSLPNSQCTVTRTRTRFAGAFSNSQLSGRSLLGSIRGTVMLDSLVVVHVHLLQCVVGDELLPPRSASYVVRTGTGLLTLSTAGPGVPNTVRRVLMPGGTAPDSRVYGDTDGDGAFTTIDVLFMEKYIAVGVSNKPERICVLKSRCQLTTRLSEWQLMQLKPVRNPNLPASRPDGGDVLFLLLALVGKTFFLAGLELKVLPGNVAIQIDLRDFEQTPNPENAAVLVKLVTTHNRQMAFNTPYGFDQSASTLTAVCKRIGTDAGFQTETLPTTVLMDEQAVGLRITLSSLDEWSSQFSASAPDRNFVFAPGGPIAVFNILGTSSTSSPIPLPMAYVPTLNCEFLCSDASLFMDRSLGLPEWINATTVKARSVLRTPLKFLNRWGAKAITAQPAETVDNSMFSSEVLVDSGDQPSSQTFVVNTNFNITVVLESPEAGMYAIQASSFTTPFVRVYGSAVASSTLGGTPRIFEAGGLVPRSIHLEFRMLRTGQQRIVLSMVDAVSTQGLPRIVSEHTVWGIPPPVAKVGMTPLCSTGVVLWSRLYPLIADEKCKVRLVGFEADGTEKISQTLECLSYPCVLQAFGFAVRPEIKTLIPVAVRFILQRSLVSVGHRAQWRLVCDTRDSSDVTVSDSAFRHGLIASVPSHALVITVDSFQAKLPGMAAISFGGGALTVGINITNALNPPSRLSCTVFTTLSVEYDYPTDTTTAVFQTPTTETPLLAGSRAFLLVQAVYNGGYSLMLDPTPNGIDGLVITAARQDVIVSQVDGSFFVAPTSGGGVDLHLVTLQFQGLTVEVVGTVTSLVPVSLEVCCDASLASASSNLHGHLSYPESFFIPPPVVILAEGRVRFPLPRLDDSALRVDHDASVLRYNHTNGYWTLTNNAPVSGTTVVSITYTHPRSLFTLTGEVRVTMFTAVGLRPDVASISLHRIHCSQTLFEAVGVTGTVDVIGEPNKPQVSLKIADELLIQLPGPSILSLEGSNVIRGLAVGHTVVTLGFKGLSTSISVTVLNESRVITSLAAPEVYDLAGVRNTTRFQLILNATLEGHQQPSVIDAVSLAYFTMQPNPFVSIEGTDLVIHATNFDEDRVSLQASVPACPPSSSQPNGGNLTASSSIKTRTVAKPGSVDLEVTLTRSTLDLVLVAPPPVFAFYVQIRTDAIGFSSCVLQENMPAFSDCVFDQPPPGTGDVIIGGAAVHVLGARTRLATLVTQSAVTSLWGFAEVFDGISVKRFSIHAGQLPGTPPPGSNRSVELLVPTLPVVDSSVISKLFAALFTGSNAQGLREALFQLSLLVNRQRLVDARVYSNEFELSVMLFVTNRFLQPVDTQDTIRVRFHTEQLDIPGSTRDPAGGQWVVAQRVLDGLYIVELRQSIPRTTLTISFSVETPISKLPWIWPPLPAVSVGEALQPCPRSATQTATFLASYQIRLPSELHVNISELLQDSLINQVACSVQVPTRRLLMNRGVEQNTIHLSVALESLARVHQTNLVLMGGWLTDEIQRRIKPEPTKNLSEAASHLIIIERDQLLFVNDSRDPPRPCPNGYFFSRNGSYHPLPLHSVAGPDCYNMFCLQGYTAIPSPDGSEWPHCIPTPVPMDIVWVCVIVILTSILALTSLTCCIHFALWTTNSSSKKVSDVVLDPPPPSTHPAVPSPEQSDDPFQDTANHDPYFHNILTDYGMDDFSVTMMMDEDIEDNNKDCPPYGRDILNGVLMPRDASVYY